MRLVFLLLELLLIRGNAVFLAPVLQFVLVSAHFVDQSAEVVMVYCVWSGVEGNGLGAWRGCDFGDRLTEDCSSGE